MTDDGRQHPPGPLARRTLIADGDVRSRAVIAWLLDQDDRFEVVASVDSGESAVAWEQPLDVALVDIALPGLDALRTVRKLRDRHPAARILVVAGVDAPYLRAAVAEAGANGYVNRGVDTERLADILASPHPEDGAGAER